MGINLINLRSACGCSRASVPAGDTLPPKEIEMGLGGLIRFGRGNSHCAHKTTTRRKKIPGNPDPKNFSILRTRIIGTFLIAKISYPDCKNYEGKKILVFSDTRRSELLKAKSLDPHFCEGEHLSPIARFEPTKKGWEMAVLMCKAVGKC